MLYGDRIEVVPLQSAKRLRGFLKGIDTGLPVADNIGLAALGFGHSPFMRFLGLEMIRAEKGVVEIRLPFREEFLRNDGSDWLAGGVVSALVDIAGDYAVITETSVGVPTIDMRVDYLRPARRGDLNALAKTVRVGRTVSVADVEIRDGTGALVAVGRACYASPRPPKAEAREEKP